MVLIPVRCIYLYTVPMMRVPTIPYQAYFRHIEAIFQQTAGAE